jgi:hypothetical protein
MSFKIVLLCCVLAIAILQSVQGQYTCTVDGLTGKKATKTVPGSPNTDTCSRSVVHNCIGEMGQSYIQCKCINTTINEVPPGVECWTPGEKLTTPDGFCNNKIPVGTAIAMFDSNGVFLTPICGAFMGCRDSSTIQIFGQRCTAPLGIILAIKGDLIFEKLHVVKAKPLTSLEILNKVDCAQRLPVLQDTCNLGIGIDICKT